MRRTRDRIGQRSLVRLLCLMIGAGVIGPSVLDARDHVVQQAAPAAPISEAELNAALGRLESDDQTERAAAAETLARAAGEGRLDAIVALIPLVTDRNGKVSYQAFHGLARTGEQAVPLLLSVFQKSNDEDFRFQIAAILGRIGPAARPAVPALREALLEPDSKVASRAAASLGGIGAHETIPDLVTLYTRTRRTSTLAQVSLALRNLGAEQATRRSKEQLVASLEAEFESTNPALRGEATKFSESLYRKAENDSRYDFPTYEQLRPLIPGLVGALDDVEAGAQLQAIRAIERAGPDAAAAAPALAGLLERDDLRASAMSALLALDSDEARGIHESRLRFEALEKRVRTRFVIADHQTRVSLSSFWAKGSAEDGVHMSARFLYRGQVPRRPEHVILYFESYSPEARLEGVDSIPWRLDTGGGGVAEVVTREIERQRSSSRIGVIEKLSGVVSVDEFLALAYAKRASARLGPVELMIPELEHEALRHLARKIPAEPMPGRTSVDH